LDDPADEEGAGVRASGTSIAGAKFERARRDELDEVPSSSEWIVLSDSSVPPMSPSCHELRQLLPRAGGGVDDGGAEVGAGLIDGAEFGPR